MNPTTPTAQPNTAYNGGQPLTPDQIQEFRTKIGVIPTAGNSAPSATGDVASQWAKYDQTRKGLTPDSEQTPIEQQQKEAGGTTEEDTRNGLQKAIGSFLDPIIKTGVRAGQAVGALAVKGIEQFQSPEKREQTEKGLQGALNSDVKVPVLGTVVKPANQETAESTIGNAVSTVGLGLPGAAAAGGALAAGQAMQENKGVGDVAINTVGGAIAGKILEHGFKVVSPYVEQAISKYGKPLYEKLAQYIPEEAKAAYSKLAEKITPETAEKAPGTIDKTANAIADKVNKPFEKTESYLKDKLGKGEKDVFDESIKTAQRKLNPENKYTSQERQELLGDQTKTKTTFGMLKRDVPDIKATAEHEAVAELHREGKLPESNTPGEDIKTIKEEARRHDQNIDEFLSDERNKGAIFNKNDTKKIFKNVLDKAEKNRVFLSNSQEEKAYKDVMSVAQEEINKNPKTMYGLRKSVKSFNGRIEDMLGSDIYTENGSPTTVGKARLQAAKDIRQAMNNHIKETLNTAHNANTPAEMKPLFEEAKKYSTPEEFIESMKTEGSASGAEQKFAEKTGTVNEQTDASPSSKSGLNVNERSTLSGKGHGKGYSTTPEQDLEEVWHMAHTNINSTRGDVFKNSLTKEAQLLSASSEIKYRAGDTLGKSKPERFLESKRGRALRRAISGLGLGIGVTEAGHLLIRGDF